MSSPPSPSPSLAANPLPGGWVDFGMDGIVTIRPGKVEYGQGVWTALAQIAAEELDVGLDQVRVAGVSTGSSPDEGVTSGSRSIQDCGGALRQVCAQVRAAFLAQAAEKLGTDPAGLEVRRGVARAGAGRAGLGYWSLDGAALLGRAAQLSAAAKPPSRWSVAGRSAPRIDLPDKVTGRPRFLHDLVLPGMLYGRVIRPPAPAATLDGVGQADLPAGVVAQVRDGSFLGVVAESDRVAVTAAERLAQAARWTVRESLPDEDDLKGFLLSQPTEDQPVARHPDPEAAAQVSRACAAEYTRPFIAARLDGPQLRDRPLGRRRPGQRVDAQPGPVPAPRGAGRRAGPGSRPGDRAVCRGRRGVRAQRLGRRRGRRGAAGPGGARPPGAAAVVPAGRAQLGAPRVRHAGPPVGGPGLRRPDPVLAAGRVEPWVRRPARHRR